MSGDAKGAKETMDGEVNGSGMSDGILDPETLDRLAQREPRYARAAYVFMLGALHHVIETLDEPRHISGRELAEGARSLALEQFGPMARTVLEHWGIESTEDFGDIVFGLVELGVLVKQETDSPMDFRRVFDFAEAFDKDYPWGQAI